MTTAAILVCRDAFAPGTRLDASAVAELLHRREPPLTMHLVDDLCARPERLRAETAGDARRLVLGVCSRDVPAAEIQQWGRRTGLDPFAVECIPLSFAAAVARDDPVRGQETAALQLASSAARLVAFLGSEPEHLRMRFAQGSVSRRAFLSLPPFAYEPVARVDQNACLGGQRCGLCLSPCPTGSISVTGSGVDVNRASCVACGVCVSRCPTGAITLPGASLGQYEAQLRTLLSQTGSLTGPVGILIGCRHAGGALDAVPENTSITVRWIPVEVPTLGMVTAGWFLQALAAGAVAVAVLACPDDIEDYGPVGECVDFCRKALHSLGHDADARLRILSGNQERSGTRLGDLPSGRLVSRLPADGVSLREPKATARALLSLRNAAPTPTPVQHASSPLGVVRIDHATCTVCGACASACPTGALTLREHADKVWLHLDPAACTACQHCVSACPERALTVRAETDVVTLAAGTVVPKTSAVTKCRGCGRPVAADAMIRRVQSLLLDQPADLLDALGTLCGSCRTAVAGL
jgi:ferredoxin